MELNSFSTAIRGRHPRAVAGIAILAMLNHSHFVESYTDPEFLCRTQAEQLRIFYDSYLR